MGKYIDIHSHILPQVDDGSPNMEQTFQMLKTAYTDGVRAIIATPHYHEGRYRNDKAYLETVAGSINEQIRNFLPGLELYLGSEIYYSHDCIKRLNDGAIPTMAGSEYILLEFSPMVDFYYMKSALQECLFAGYIPIIAHIERYRCFEKNTESVNELVEMGVYIQANAMSITGNAESKFQKLTKKLIKDDLVHFIATDAHNSNHRSPSLKECIKYIGRKYGSSLLYKYLADNPGKILSNEYI